MTQISRPQSGKYSDGYHDAGGYTSEQWARIFSILLTLNEETEGVVKHLSDMVVTNPLDTVIRVASGAALVRGRLFVNEDQDNPAASSDVDFTVDPPSTGSRTDRVVLVQNNTDYDYDGTPDYGAAVLQIPDDTSDYEYGTSFVAASGIPPHTCRLALLLGDESSGGAMRALTQDASVIAGDIWMLELARYTINSAGAITLTDMRDYAPKFMTENLADNAVTPAKISNRTREVFIPVDSGSAGIVGNQRGIYLPNGTYTEVYGHGKIPCDFVADAILIPVICNPGIESGGFNQYARFEYLCNMASNGEMHITHIAGDIRDMPETPLHTIVFLDALALPNVTIGDTLGISFARHGDLDTSDQTFYLRGFILRYTADS